MTTHIRSQCKLSGEHLFTDGWHKFLYLTANNEFNKTKVAKIMKVNITEAQLRAIMEITDTLSAMIGVGSDFDINTRKQIKLIDRFLKKNKYNRNFK